MNEVTIEVREKENYAIVGESGSGKTTLGYILARVFEPTSGAIWFQGEEITHIQDQKLKQYRRKVQMVFQDPASSLNPYHSIESILSLPLKIYESMGKKERLKKVAELLEAVHLPPEIMKRHPGSLSGGQKQRISLARALALNPRLFILDEPTSALDVSVQAKILHLLQELKQTFGLTFIFITHDLIIVRNLADRVAVMYLGRIVEMAPAAMHFRTSPAPLHEGPPFRHSRGQRRRKAISSGGSHPGRGNPFPDQSPGNLPFPIQVPGEDSHLRNIALSRPA